MKLLTSGDIELNPGPEQKWRVNYIASWFHYIIWKVPVTQMCTALMQILNLYCSDSSIFVGET